jgi:hypothetical protein
MKSALSAALLTAAFAASAQTAPRAPREFPPELVFDVPLLAPACGGALAFEAHDGEAQLGTRLVKGAPFCADAVHETVQPLLDADGAVGNRIVRQQKTRLCRDGEGRTRQEVERHGRKLVYLRDPVAREAWVLDSERKTAHGQRSLAFGGEAGGSFNEMADGAAWRDYTERVREWARGFAERARASTGRAASAPPSPATPPAAPAPGAAPLRDAEVVAIVRRSRDEAAAASRDGGVDLRVLRIQGAGGGAGLAPLPPLSVPPGVSWAAEAFAPRGPATLSPLGSKEIEGLRVNGERSSWTIAAGKLGNEKAIVVVRDVWTSPELMLTVHSRDFDPRRGETNYRLLNLKRGEPDPASMKVPADFSKSGGRG